MSSWRQGPEGGRWAAWLDPLMPDEVSRQRLRKRVLEAAAPLLRARARSWQDVAAGWSSLLTPIAAALVLVFGALAYAASRPAGQVGDSVSALEIEPLLAEETESPPTLLTGASEPSRESVFIAAIAYP